MKSKRSSTKALLAFIVTLILAVSFSVTAFAADRYENCGNRYGRIIPTDEKLEAQVFDYYFKGDRAPIHFMRMSTGEPGACYAIEIYADAEQTTLLKYLSREYSTTAGHAPIAITLPFDGLKSGTYYGKCYTYVTRSDGTIYDMDSIQYFNIHIDRLSGKTVVLSGVHNTDAGISVNWTPLETASQYHVYRKINGWGDWAYVATLGEGASNYIDTDVINGNYYTYTVCASDGGYWSGFDANGVTIARLSTPTLNYVNAEDWHGCASLYWTPVDGADGYYVYRKGGSLSSYDWQLIANVQGGYSSHYLDYTATSTNWNYNYTVVAYKGESRSSYNPQGLEFNYMTAPVITKAFSTNYGVYVEWQKNDRKTESYNIYRKTWNGNWEYVGSTCDTWFTDTTASSGVDYIYTVVGVYKTNNSAFINEGWAVKYLATPHLNGVSFDDYNNAIVNWNYVGGAEKYHVYRKLSYETNWSFVAEVYDTYYYDTSEKISGETYTYTVIAYIGDYGSAYDNVGVFGHFLSAPNVNAYNVYNWNSSAIQVDWNYVNGATRYDVYRCDYGSNNWMLIAGGVTSDSYVDYTANPYYGYSYAVIAVNDYASSKFNVASVLAVPTAGLEYCTVGNEGGVHLGWTALTDGVIYHVYRRTIDGYWEEIGTSTTNYFCDWSQEAVNQYFIYTVTAEYYGYYSGFDGVGIANFAEVRNLYGVLTEGETPFITVNWELDGFTQWYELTKTVNGQTVSLGVFSSDSGVTQYVDTDISIGNEYTYSVKASCDGRFYKINSTTVKYPLPPVPVTPVGGANGYVSEGKVFVDIVWGYVDYAESYTVYRRTDATDWVALATISVSDLVNGPIYTDTTAEFDINYYYTVVGNASNRDSLYDNNGVSAIVLKPVSHPYGVTVKEDIINTQTVAVVGWDAVDKAEYYSVFRKEANSDWVYLGTIWDGNCSFVDYNIVRGIKYTYTVTAGATNRGEAANPVGATFRWNINGKDFVYDGFTGLYECLGTWYYFENGDINWNANTLVKYGDSWFYVLNGEIAWDYVGLVCFNDVWYYVENGVVNFNATTLVYFYGDWYYVENGVLNWNYTNLFYFCDDWYYVENGKVNFNATTLVHFYGDWYYVENGKVNFNATTLCYFDGDWYYVENGKVNFNATTLVYFCGDWYYVEYGKVNFNMTTLFYFYDKWYYVENGKVNFNATTAVEFYGEWYYVENGVVNFEATTLVYYGDAWYYVENGKLKFDATTLCYYCGEWYYVENGKVNFDATKLFCFYDEWYYIEKGVLNWNSEAIATHDGVRYYVSGGKIAWDYTGDVVINDIMYRVKDGVVLDVAFDLNPVYGNGDLDINPVY